MNKISKNHTRTRLAPTPSGFLHIGNAFSFACTAWLARATGAKILLRIDDMDRERVRKEYIEDIFDTLQFLSIPWDEGPHDHDDFEKNFSQLHRMSLYTEALHRLQADKAVFACSCSRTQLQSAGAGSGCVDNCHEKKLPLEGDYAWRISTDKNKSLSVMDIAGNSVNSTLPSSVQQFAVRKKDGAPAYQLSSLVDDVHYGIDLIVRGKDLWPSTLAQQYLAGLLGKKNFQQVSFWHHGLLQGNDGQKLSKSAGAGSVKYFREQGGTKEKLFTLIASLNGISGQVRDWNELGERICKRTGLLQ